MKKTGFTLAESLITLVVIGIISAITLPAINKLMPDENKINCIKAYDTLSALVKNLASNTKIYPVCKNPEQNDNQNCSEYPLFNTNQPQLLAAFNDVKYSGDKKLCNLLASFMNVKDASCEENVYSFSAANFNTQFNNNKSFITANGMQWYVVPAVTSAYAGGIGTFQTDVYVDVNGNKAPNCIYNADSCKKPDRFKFMVAADGSVQAADPVSRGYINSRKIFNKQGLNIQESANITSEVRVRTFGLKKCKEEDNSLLPPNNPDTTTDTTTYITCHVSNVVSGNNIDNIVLEMPNTITCDTSMPQNVIFETRRRYQGGTNSAYSGDYEAWTKLIYGNEYSSFDEIPVFATGKCTIKKGEYSCKEQMTYHFNYDETKPVILMRMVRNGITRGYTDDLYIYAPYVLGATYNVWGNSLAWDAFTITTEDIDLSIIIDDNTECYGMCKNKITDPRLDVVDCNAPYLDLRDKSLESPVGVKKCANWYIN